MKTGALFFITDVCIVTVSGFIFKDVDAALYAGIAVIVTAVVLDVVLYGRDGAKLVYIISDCQERITDRVLADLDVGVTHLSGAGAYSKKDKKIIMCVVKKPLLPRIEEVVKEEDSDAFYDCNQRYGNIWRRIQKLFQRKNIGTCKAIPQIRE